jgi:hypothetical protein
MDPQDLLDRLISLRGYGKTAQEVLGTSSLVRDADASWTPQEVSAFMQDAEMHPKVWEKLRSIAQDTRLQGVSVTSLPSTYTALYALVVLSDEEWTQAMQEGVIRSDASTRSIQEWTRSHRLKDQGFHFEQVLRLVSSRELTPDMQKDLVEEISTLSQKYGVRVLTEEKGSKQRGVQSEKRKTTAERLESELTQSLAVVFDDASSPLKSQFNLSTVSDLVNGEMRIFTGFLVRHFGSTEGMWSGCGRDYCLKVALEFNRTDSRAQRHNYKKRLLDVCKTHPELALTAGEIAEKYLT